MIYRKLDANGDMQFGVGSAGFLSNTPETVAQAVLTRLKLLRGEWFIDTTAGVPYSSQVLGFGNVHSFDFVIREEIANTQGVLNIASYYSFIDTKRNASISCTIDTIYGQTTVNTPI